MASSKGARMREQEQKAHSSEVHTLLETQWQEMRLPVPLGPSFAVNKLGSQVRREA